MRMVYFDYNATTPLDKGVLESMLPYLNEIFGNPSSVHQVGRRARAMLDDARDRMAKAWKTRPSEVVFTSGGTESNNLAIFGSLRFLREKGRHLITSQIEHHAVLHAFQYLEKKEGFDVTYLPVSRKGQVDPADLRKSIRSDTILVSVMSANNEIGSLQPVSELGSICREKGVIFHTDAVQSMGKEPFLSMAGLNADLVSVCAHKFHGPKGAGALFIRSPFQPHPILFGGGHENEKRAGTENLPTIAGMVEAFERFVQKSPVFERSRLQPMVEKLESAAAEIPGVVLQGSRDQRLCNTMAFTVEGADGISLMAGLDLEGICASSGSACSAGSLAPSHVILALGVAKNVANSLVRFSLGRENTMEEVDYVCEQLPGIIARLRTG